jgi:hypothetical protein
MIKQFGQLLRVAAAVLLPALAAGCLPNATWLPDSSGFVYTGGKDKDKLYVYDLEKKEPRVLVEKGAGPAWPAVSADGKRIAVALCKDVGKGGFMEMEVEVIVFDRDGMELHRSAKLKWPNSLADGEGLFAQVFWVPGQDKLLLDANQSSGFYDLTTKSIVMLEHVRPSTYRNTPIRPDGKGFLAVLTDGNLAFIDWDGNKHKIQVTPKDKYPIGGLTPLDELNRQIGDGPRGMFQFPMLHSSRWDDSTAVVSWDDRRLKIDTDKLTATVDQIKPAMSADGKLIQDQVKLAGGAVVRAVELRTRYPKPTNDPNWPNHWEGPQRGRFRVEVVKPNENEPTTLMHEAFVFMIDPSPDGKKAVVKCMKASESAKSKSDQDMLFLIDGNGDVADKIDLAK